MNYWELGIFNLKPCLSQCNFILKMKQNKQREEIKKENKLFKFNGIENPNLCDNFWKINLLNLFEERE